MPFTGIFFNALNAIVFNNLFLPNIVLRPNSSKTPVEAPINPMSKNFSDSGMSFNSGLEFISSRVAPAACAPKNATPKLPPPVATEPNMAGKD